MAKRLIVVGVILSLACTSSPATTKDAGEPDGPVAGSGDAATVGQPSDSSNANSDGPASDDAPLATDGVAADGPVGGTDVPSGDVAGSVADTGADTAPDAAGDAHDASLVDVAVVAKLPDGQVCQNPGQCLSGQCTAGLCGCKVTTCAAQGKNCGSIGDGCGGTLTCGSCGSPATCGGNDVANVCGCKPTTCAAQGKNCGSIGDGCGGTLTCGSCGNKLTIIKTGMGSGRVTSTPAGIDCGPTCSNFLDGTNVTLRAVAINGSGSRFAGWEGACTGTVRDCSLVLTGDITVTARFEPVAYNLAFVSSKEFRPDLGGVAKYDNECNVMATDAGINNATGDAFVAWISDSTSSALTRLGAARGFVDIAGQPIMDVPSTTVAKYSLYHPFTFDETGRSVRNRSSHMVLTGMNYRGEPDLDQNCLNWTTAGTNGRGVAGLIANGPQTWFYYEIGTCDYMHGALICMMKTQTTPLTLSPVTGKKIFITNEPVGADEAMDSICEVDKPAGTGAVVALRATTTKAPATLIDPAATYVRPDGVVVGSGADIIAANLQTGIWQQGNGKYVDSRGLWTGSINLSTVGTAVTTCSDWTSTTGTATEGSTTRSDYSWWHDFNTIDCSRSFTWAICVEK